MASDHWHQLLERWRQQRRERGQPLLQEPEVSLRAREVLPPEPGEIYAHLLSVTLRPLEVVRQSLPTLRSYDLSSEDLSDFITQSSYSAVRKLQSVDDRLWKELEETLGSTSLTEPDYQKFAASDQARLGLFSARVARDGFELVDLNLQVFSPSYAASDLRAQVASYLAAEDETSAQHRIERMLEELRTLPERMLQAWSEPMGRIDGAISSRVVLSATSSGDYLHWQVFLQESLAKLEQLRVFAGMEFPLVTVLGPAGMAAGAMVRAGIQEAMYREAPLTEEWDEWRQSDLLDERNRKWAALLLARFGRHRLMQLRSVLLQLERVCSVLISLGAIHVRRTHFQWDALLTELVFESRLREWRLSLLRFFVHRVLPVLDLLVEVEDLLNELRMKELLEHLNEFLDELSVFVGRVLDVLRDIDQEHTARRDYLHSDLLRQYRRVSRLIRFRAALRRAIEVVNEFLALPEISLDRETLASLLASPERRGAGASAPGA